MMKCEYCNTGADKKVGKYAPSACIEQYGNTYGMTVTVNEESFVVLPIYHCPVCGKKLVAQQLDEQPTEVDEMLEVIEASRQKWANEVTLRSENEYIREGLLNADYFKRHRGRWIKHDSMPLACQCSVCGGWHTKTSILQYDHSFCHCCGADMRPKSDEEGSL